MFPNTEFVLLEVFPRNEEQFKIWIIFFSWWGKIVARCKWIKGVKRLDLVVAAVSFPAVILREEHGLPGC